MQVQADFGALTGAPLVAEPKRAAMLFGRHETK
jgi:hypothetical protein